MTPRHRVDCGHPRPDSPNGLICTRAAHEDDRDAHAYEMPWAADGRHDDETEDQ